MWCNLFSNSYKWYNFILKGAFLSQTVQLFLLLSFFSTFQPFLWQLWIIFYYCTSFLPLFHHLAPTCFSSPSSSRLTTPLSSSLSCAIHRYVLHGASPPLSVPYPSWRRHRCRWGKESNSASTSTSTSKRWRKEKGDEEEKKRKKWRKMNQVEEKRTTDEKRERKKIMIFLSVY